MWSQILTALLVGLLSAFAFQLLLTSFQVAIGITALGVHFNGTADSNVDSTAERVDSKAPDFEAAPTGSTANVGFLTGVSILLTVNIVLFSACFLATKFSQITNPLSGAIAGVVIWSAYFLISIWVSSTAVSTLLGSVLSLATGGFRQLVTTIAATFQRQKDAPLTQAEAIAMIQQEIQDVLSPTALDQRIQQSLNRHLALPQTVQIAPTSQRFVNLSAADQPNNLPDLSPEEINRQLWQPFESYLHRTPSKQLTPERINYTLETLLKETLENSGHQNHVLAFDRADLKALLKQRKGLKKKQRRQILQHVETTWNQMVEQSETAPPATTKSADKPIGLGKSFQPIATYVKESLQKLDDKLSDDEIELEAALRQNLPQLSSISSVVALAILQQLNQIDWETVLNRLPLQSLDETQIEQVLTEVRSIAQDVVNKPQQWTEDYLIPQTQNLKNQVMQQADSFQQTVQDQIEILKQRTQQRIESTRKTVAAAVWWLSITAFTAAISAAFSGALAAGMPISVHL